SPAQEVYGFVMYLASFILYVGYLLWAFIPDSVFHHIGITYLPSKYWALIWPVWTLLLVVFIWAYFLSIHLLRTPPFDSFHTITDEYANVAPGLHYARTGHSADHIPELQDLPITIVNACLY
ncbi:MAG: PIG-P, partial [Piptocephalis tieghemiana]